ncbi:outer membrane protein assembly factor BamB family protein [Dawidia soli]|uniref:PQQ-binding-like beta-propeller repeat protein n=1 Tax=Dawidia soli TaxID=2782352 RepID=A0AAP2GES1_9BACT|nr:PQQ-binding-like beta-propeller repeat protein [Dawidia soli]MBT1688702.1 PQQ-binding-like beta-propeller repeat protein [Dawidia soli]
MREVIKTYENVTDFDVKSGNALIHYENEEVWINDRLVTTGLRGVAYSLCADRVFYAVQETRTTMYEIESQAVKTFDHLYEDGSFINGLAVFREGEQYEEVSIASGAVNPLALRRGAGGSFFTSDYIVHGSYEQNKRERILCYDRAARSYIWEYDVKALRYSHELKANKEYDGEIKTILGFFRDIVIVAVKGEKLLALDAKTGELRWRIDFVEGATPEFMRSPRLPSAGAFRIDHETGKLISFYQNMYIRIDIESGKAEVLLNVFDEFQNNGLLLMHNDWYQEGNLIYYFVSGFDLAPPQVIAYDLAQEKIDWTHVFEARSTNPIFPKYFLKTMRYDSGRFFVLDSNNVLTVLKN